MAKLKYLKPWRRIKRHTQLNRTMEHLIPFSEWNSKSIERRQTMLARLAVFVWDMPGPRLMPDDGVGFDADTKQRGVDA